MATPNNNNETSEWSWSSWVTTAKEKSLAALNATTRDLAEFVNVVQGDTTSVVSEAATKVKQIMNQQDEQQGNDNNDDNGDNTSSNQPNDGSTHNQDTTVSYDRTQTNLELMRSDPNTYCTMPEGKGVEFLEWSKDFDLSNQQEEISRLLVASNSIRKLHSTMVPAKVSYESFWFNYFYRVYLTDKVDAHRAEIMARVHSQGQLICWDDDDELEGHTDDVTIVTRDEGVMTDSSESFVCINEDKIDNENEELVINNDKKEELVINNDRKEELVSNNDKKEELVINKQSEEMTKEESDDDWEKWDN